MTPIDSLKIGDWIAICSEKCGNEYRESPLNPDRIFSGQPVKLLAISLPFLAVWVPKLESADTIDVRRHGVVRLSKRFVTKLTTLRTVDFNRTSEEVQCRSSCPSCGCVPLQETITPNGNETHYFCAACGFTGYSK